MTEDQWLACDDPTRMVDFIQRDASARKLRLFAVACCRRIWPRITDDRSRRAVETAERYADGLAGEDELRGASDAARLAVTPAAGDQLDQAAVAACDTTERWATAAAVWASASSARATPDRGESLGGRCDLLRDIFGNPFQSTNPFRWVVVEPRWLTSTVVSLAAGIYEDRAFDRLPILADALQDAGCDTADVLDHCRGDGRHVRGCWVVDLVLGKG
jgi:hypothetical protein